MKNILIILMVLATSISYSQKNKPLYTKPYQNWDLKNDGISKSIYYVGDKDSKLGDVKILLNIKIITGGLQLITKNSLFVGGMMYKIKINNKTHFAYALTSYSLVVPITAFDRKVRYHKCSIEVGKKKMEFKLDFIDFIYR